MATVQVRYIVNDIDTAIEFYMKFLDLRLGNAPSASLCDALPQRSPSRTQCP